MEEKKEKPREGTDWLGLASFGFFLILLGAVWISTPNLTDEVINFFQDFELRQLTEHMIFPAPAHSHPVVYTAAMHFFIFFGCFQIIILVLRFVFHDSMRRKAETVSGIGFLFAISLFLQMLVNETIGWLGFLGGIIISAGVAVVISSLVKLLE